MSFLKSTFFLLFIVQAYFTNAQTALDGKIAQIDPSGEKRITCFKYYYVNGIGTPYEKAVAQAQRVADTLNTRVTLVYSATTQNAKHPKRAKFGDILTTILLRMGKKNKAVDSLYHQIFADLEKGDSLIFYGHSRGALIGYFATKKVCKKLKRVKRSDLLAHISVLTVGGFAPSAQKWKVKMCEAVNRYDLVPFIAGNPAKGSHLRNISKKKHSLTHYLGYIHYFDSEDKIQKYDRKRVSDVPE